MNRRKFVVAGSAAMTAGLAGWRVSAAAPSSDSRSSIARHVEDLAERLARAPYAAPPDRVPPPLKDIGYDVYRDIQFKQRNALWRGARLGFEVHFAPTAYLYHTPIDIFVVDGAEVMPLSASVSQFRWGPLAKKMSHYSELAFSGFRILSPLNDVNRLDELLVFQGASYFRALGRGHQYGISARGLALNTARPEPEEFPLFRSFWLERPTHPSHVVVHALLDGPSAAGAFRFVIRPGASTTMDIESVLFPRVDLVHVGIAPLTSMFWFDGRDAANRQDFRVAVHDSDGLAVLTQAGESLWRPLSSPQELQASAFIGGNPRGFGLIQRARSFVDYQDLEARYERRPSAWVERANEWGDGHVELIEIPAGTEYFDNIVAYWRPASPLRAGQRHAFDYRLYWCDAPPEAAPRLRVARTGHGESRPGIQRFVIDYELTTAHRPESIGTVEELVGLIGRSPEPFRPIEAVLSASGGLLGQPVMQPNPHVNGLRVSFELDPREEKTIELRLALVVGGEVDSEVWLHRWLRPRPVPPAAPPPAQAP